MTSTTRNNLPVIVFLTSVGIFVVSQLVINSILNPMGTELQSLNSEKNFLVEENRSMEEEIAKTNSITVIKKLAEKTLDIKAGNTKTVVYLEKSATLAER